jgi:hypothetical protein
MAFKSFDELYDLFIDEFQSQAPEVTDTEEGSILDVISGVTALAVDEVQTLVSSEFAKTFFDTANGPEVTGGPDDLEKLAVDHFGSAFARPAATLATGTVTFSRPTSGAGNITIPAGTIVKTAPNANGDAQRFETVAAVTITGLTINASVRALVAGTDGNVQSGTVIFVETTLLDSTIIVTNAASFTGGEEEQSDSEYRETIRLLIQSLAGATKGAIEAKALTVAGVEKATAVEFLQYVIEWDIANSVTIGDYFGIPRARVYIADANGVASGALILDVEAAIEFVRACGVRVDVLAAVAVSLNWVASLSLNPSGPNFATLQTDTTMIVDDMIGYIQDLAIGDDFDRGLARLYIMNRWGPSGTNDLTDFVTSTPTGNVTYAANEKAIPGTVSA